MTDARAEPGGSSLAIKSRRIAPFTRTQTFPEITRENSEIVRGSLVDLSKIKVFLLQLNPNLIRVCDRMCLSVRARASALVPSLSETVALVAGLATNRLN